MVILIDFHVTGVITGAKINGKNAQTRLCPLFDNVDLNSVLVREENMDSSFI